MDQQHEAAGSSAGIAVTTNRRRRPSGTAPPLPKQIGYTGWVWLIALVAVVVTGCLWLRADPGPLDRFDASITDAVISVRTGWLDTFAEKAHTVGSRVGFAALGLLLVFTAAWFHRWRHLVIWIISLGITGALLQGLELVALRPRPFGVQQLASWEGYATPSIPIGATAFLWIGVAFMLVVPGRPRFWAKIAAAVAIAITGALRIYLGVDHFTDVVFGAIVGVAIAQAGFRAFAPNDLFPVTYGARGKSAHLDVTGRRGEAIRIALQDQLGFTVHDIKPVGLEGSGGSTPLKLTVTDEEGRDADDLREALREEPRARGPLVQARPHDALRTARGRDTVQHGPPVRRVRGLHPPHARRIRVPDARGARHRGDHAGARVPDRDGLLRRRGRDRRGRDRRARDRRGARDDPADVGRRARPPRHQAGQPDGASTGS